MTTLALLTAAGSGSRLGYDLPKALVDLQGLPLLLHAARRLQWSDVVDVLVVTAPPGLSPQVEDLLRADQVLTLPWYVVDGSGTRQASVRAGLSVLDAAPDPGAQGSARPSPLTGVDVVLVHDAARPLAPPELVRRVVQAVRSGHGAVVPGIPVTDTVKRVEPAPSGAAERVLGTADRSALRAVQTPQGFDRALLLRAHEAAGERGADEATAATDDAGLVEALGEPVHVVPGDPAAHKVTTARDLRFAGLLLEEER